MIKRVIFLLAIMLPASASTATVFIFCTDLGDGVVELSYDASEESVPVSGFGLDICVSSGVITSVGNLSADYWVYPGQIVIFAGQLVDVGTPVCSPGFPGTLGGLGTGGMTVEMGALYPPDDGSPPPNGVLLTFTVSATCNVTVTENAVRGGVVLKDGRFADIYAPPLLVVLSPITNMYGGGAGTVDDPYLISTSEHLYAIGVNPGDWDKHFKLVADIDLSCYTGKDFHLIGTTSICPFSGVFDGNNHKIYNLTYNNNSNLVGLFGYIDGDNAEIKDLCLINPDVNAGKGCNVGCLAGIVQRGAISRCCAVGGSVSGGDGVGGLVGDNYDGIISNCYARTNVSGLLNLGGLVGKGYDTVINCYSTGYVPEDANIIGGLAGYNYSMVSNSFWDTESSGQADAVGGTGEMGVTEAIGKTTTQMQMASAFTAAGWDFEGESANGTQDIWTIREGKTYPRFARQVPQGDITGSEGVDMSDFAFFVGHWMNINCSNSNNCDGTDLDKSDMVDMPDLVIFANNWLAGI